MLPPFYPPIHLDDTPCSPVFQLIALQKILFKDGDIVELAEQAEDAVEE